MTEPLSADVLVIGAGPAGSTLAALLAMKGFDVALADRDVFPRDKVCGEFLSYDALPVLDLLGLSRELDLRGSPFISRCRIITPGRRYEFGFPRHARGVSRLLLDDLLLRRAGSLGATLLDGWTAVGLEHGGSHTLVRLSDGERTRSVRARAVAGSWGRWGRFDLQLDRAFVRDYSNRHFGYKKHFRSSSAGASETCIDLYPYKGGYLGVSSIEGRLTNICGLVHGSRIAAMRGKWDAFILQLRRENRALDALFSSHLSAQESFLSSEPVVFRARSPVAKGIFMVGDAAGIIDPLTGSGMAMAVQGALLAAPFFVRRLSGATASSVEDDYARTHRAFFHSRLTWSRGAAFMMSRPRLVETAIGLVRSEAIGNAFLHRTRAPVDRVEALAEAWLRPV